MKILLFFLYATSHRSRAASLVPRVAIRSIAEPDFLVLTISNPILTQKPITIVITGHIPMIPNPYTNPTLMMIKRKKDIYLTRNGWSVRIFYDDAITIDAATTFYLPGFATTKN